MQHRKQKFAIFGGTFDPIHFGHLLIAEQAYNNFSLEEVIFMPAGNPPHKKQKSLCSSKHRLEMTRIAVRDNPHFTVSDWELNNNGDSYTVDTLRHMEESYQDAEFYFIIGADSLYDIYNWKEPEYLLSHAHFIVARRPDFTLNNIFVDEKYGKYRDHIHLMDSLLIEISSSQIRQNIRTGSSIRYQTPSEVIGFIEKNNLYRGG